MDLRLDYTQKNIKNVTVRISGSKSESNRLLILKQLFPNIELANLSDSDDTIHLQEALQSNSGHIDIGHAGTAMRFLTAFFSVQEGREVILTGSNRMQNRPIEILVEALNNSGANITYLEKHGYPPLKIKGKELNENTIRIQGNVSSQYLSALLLIAPALPEGLILELIGEITSAPYLKMTLQLLKDLGISWEWSGNRIRVFPVIEVPQKKIIVESDWSSASYFYSLVALSQNAEISLRSFKENSLQGDSRLTEIFAQFGVSTVFEEDKIVLRRDRRVKPKKIDLDLIEQPDIAQTIAVTCFGLGIECNLTGLHTLKIKETDRLLALQNELNKLGADISVTGSSLHLKASEKINSEIEIKTYEDHRMAMAFAPLAIKVPIKILNAEVVTKSYKNFWSDLESVFEQD